MSDAVWPKSRLVRACRVLLRAAAPAVPYDARRDWLLLARAAARRSEVAVRAALGAGRLRLARESLLESMLLTLGGGLTGIVLSIGGVRVVADGVRGALDTFGTRWLQFVNPDALTVDRGVVAIGLGITFTIGLLLGLLPARTASRPDLTRNLRAGRSDVGARRDTLHIGFAAD